MEKERIIGAILIGFGLPGIFIWGEMNLQAATFDPVLAIAFAFAIVCAVAGFYLVIRKKTQLPL
jgi:hypothetical protein